MSIKTSNNPLLVSVFFIGLILFFSSCNTYIIPVDTFKEQLSKMNESNMREVTAQGPMGDRVKYMTYDIDNLSAIDKNGNAITIPNSPAIEIRFTDSADKRTVFYFDLMRFDGTNITGRQSRFMNNFVKSIPVSSIRKIEIQNSKKSFRYVE